MDEELLYMMRKISLNWTMQLEMNLKDKNVTGIQVYFLVYILRHHVKGTYLTELYHEIGVSKATLSAMIKKLIKEGYLYFQENPEDIRKKKVLPTEKLMADKEEFLKRARQTEDKICSALNCQEKMKLRELEQKILEQCERTEHKEKKRRREVL